eukprot:TRINITY_DN652_c0_g1_i2.p1 TRINITY_DN652_c0_g1~~TRINITY_DN652_c0_g1_i2.p1  ORF type:complete len:206 (-),score=46.97 TRINITY_DN652_c0_g1_i2:61-678(-)
MAGSCAGAVSVIFTYPLDVIRTRIASQNFAGPRPYNGVVDALTKMAKYERSALYKGIVPTLYGILPYAGINFMVYGTIKSKYREHFRKEPGAVINFCTGAVSGCLSQTICYPLDVVRRRMQVEGFIEFVNHPIESFVSGKRPVSPDPEKRRGIWKMMVDISSKEGLIKGLFKGVTINFIKTPIAIAISFVVYDKWKTIVGSGKPL